MAAWGREEDGCIVSSPASQVSITCWEGMTKFSRTSGKCICLVLRETSSHAIYVPCVLG